MRKYAAISVLFHAVVFAIAWFGVPDLFRRDLPEDKPLIVEVLPLSSITNAPPPKPEPPKVVEAPKPPEPKPEPPKPEPPKVVEAPKPEPPKPVPSPPPPAAAPPPPPPPPAPAPAPRAEAPLPPPPKQRPEPPKPTKQVAQAEQPPVQKQKQQAFDLNNMLRDLTRAKPQQATTPQPAPQQQAQAAPRAASNAPHNPNIPLSMTEEDAIRQRIVQNWNLDIGAKGIETFFVELQLMVTPDGTVQDARIVRTQGDPPDALRGFAEGARRAALRSSPLPLPPSKANQMTGGNLYLTFSARDMLGSVGRRS
ncbi:MAG TPA: energy transducer TonB [Alphaproteobacteria bacterium]|nr:energy transducer TonB [Alphaproteobacteria bacterium]